MAPFCFSLAVDIGVVYDAFPIHNATVTLRAEPAVVAPEVNFVVLALAAWNEAALLAKPCAIVGLVRFAFEAQVFLAHLM